MVSSSTASQPWLASNWGKIVAAQAATNEAEGADRRGWRMPRALPRLQGRWLTAFTILWLVLLPLAVAMPVISVVSSVRWAESPIWIPIGLAVDSSGDEVRIDAATTRESKAAGVRSGDVVVAIDGHGVHGGSSGYAEIRPVLLRPEGTSFSLSVRGLDGRTRTVRLTRRLAHIDEPFEDTGLSTQTVSIMGSVGGFLPALFFVPAAILLFRRRREAVAALLSLALLLLSAGEFAGTAGWFELGLPDWIRRLASSTGWTALLLVLLTFPKGDFRPGWTVWLVPPLLVWIALFASGIILYLLSVGPLVLLMAGAVANLALRYRRMEPDAERQQMRWVLFGFAAGIASLTVALILALLSETLFAGDYLAAIWLQILFYFFGPLGGVFIAGGLLVSLLRFRLYDAESVISRSAGLALLTLALAAIFAASAEAIEALFELRFGRDAGALPGAVGAGLAVMMITPLHRRLQGWAERRFQKALGHLRRDLPACVDDLRETASLDELLGEVLARIEAGARAVRSAVAIDGKLAAVRGVEGRGANSAVFPITIPLKVGHAGQVVGTLLVGPRPDGTGLGKDEREVLDEIADPVARAIRVVMAREDREAATKKSLAAIQRRLTRIERGGIEKGKDG